jgi:hypothetical protein
MKLARSQMYINGRYWMALGKIDSIVRSYKCGRKCSVCDELGPLRAKRLSLFYGRGMAIGPLRGQNQGDVNSKF